MKKKSIMLFLASVLIVSNIVPVYADNSIENVETTTQTNDTGLKNEEVTVKANVGSEFIVTIPKTITMSGVKDSKANYSVTVKGNLEGFQFIDVIPEDNFNLVQAGKDNSLATITQEKSRFSYDDTKDDKTAISNGLISATLSAGSWEGKFNFNVKSVIDKPAGLYGTNGFTSWNDLITTGIININEGVLTTQFKSIDYSESNDSAETLKGELVVPNTVTVIGDNAFNKCMGLTKVELPEGITSIGKNAFSGCYYLTETNMPNSVVSIGDWAYSSTKISDLQISNKLETIGIGAFYGCNKLKSITLPDTLTTIGSQAFYQCYELGKVIIPNSVTSIGDMTFFCCTNLDTVIIGNKITKVSDSMFNLCENLSTVWIPSSVNEIGSYAFSGCVKLNTIYFAGNESSWNAITKNEGWNYKDEWGEERINPHFYYDSEYDPAFEY